MIDNLFKKREYYKLINRDITNKIPYGYCNYYLHRGYLSKNLMDKKGCREKQCKYLVKNEGHPYFEIKARNKLIKKAKKDGKSTYVYNGVTYLIT